VCATPDRPSRANVGVTPTQRRGSRHRTSLFHAANARGWNETAWNGAGSGCSAFDPKPFWQNVAPACFRRSEADVAAVADPGTGVAVYDSFGGSAGWTVFGGTSAAAPIIAAVYALAASPAAAVYDYPASYPYARRGHLFDVTAGGNGDCGAPFCTAGAGWGRADRSRHTQRHGRLHRRGSPGADPRRPRSHIGRSDTGAQGVRLRQGAGQRRQRPYL